MINKFILLFDTIKHLKLSQILFQVIYKFKRVKNLTYYSDEINYYTKRLNFVEYNVPYFTDGTYHFEFLNTNKKFSYKIDWNFMDYGKLWNYNLQYLNCLAQNNINTKHKYELLNDIHNSLYSGELKLEPYPTSLRIINTIRFTCKYSNDIDKVELIEINRAIYSQTNYLYKNLEYHILGNHLLENAFALLVSSEYFGVFKWKDKAEVLLRKELNEQIIQDGAHFELSPMYHQIIYFRLLEAISIIEESDFKNFLIEKASMMFAWLKLITFNNGKIPHFNDSTNDIALTSNELFELSEKLKIPIVNLPQFTESGYRKFKSELYELIADVNGVKPSYQPGHAHSDHLSFVLNIKNFGFLVDPGISTYNICERRQLERSSKFHNTVTVNDKNQSEVWSGFRVAKRADVKVLSESIDNVIAVCKYGNIFNKIIHTREFQFENNLIVINDIVNANSINTFARFYLHPDINDITFIENSEIHFGKLNVNIAFINAKDINVVNYDYSLGYNKLITAKCIEVQFDSTLTTKIKFNA